MRHASVLLLIDVLIVFNTMWVLLAITCILGYYKCVSRLRPVSDRTQRADSVGYYAFSD